MTPTSPEDRKAGYLIVRLKPGEGVQIGKDIEVRIAQNEANREKDTEIAVRAPREIPIRRVK